MTIDNKQSPRFSRPFSFLQYYAMELVGGLSAFHVECLPAQSSSVAPLGNHNTTAHSGSLSAMTPPNPALLLCCPSEIPAPALSGSLLSF